MELTLLYINVMALSIRGEHKKNEKFVNVRTAHSALRDGRKPGQGMPEYHELFGDNQKDTPFSTSVCLRLKCLGLRLAGGRTGFDNAVYADKALKRHVQDF